MPGNALEKNRRCRKHAKKKPRQAAAGLLYCMWAPGHLLYELVLVVVFMALAIVLPTAHMEPFRDRVNGATP